MSNDFPAVLETYWKMWNEPDPHALLPLIEACCSDDVIFADPNAYTVGHDALVAMAIEVKEQIPNAIYRRASGFDLQHRRHRYLWEIEYRGRVVVRGMDVTTLNDAGMIERIDGFFTHAPPEAEG